MIIQRKQFVVLASFTVKMSFGTAPTVSFQNQANVRATTILFRHGQRTPIHAHPSFDNKLSEEIGPGQLTNTGIRQLYNNGALLHERYRHLFPVDGLFKLSNMKIMTSVPERTMMSLQSFMTGFFPPPKSAESLLPLHWQPFFCTVDHKGKTIYYDNKSCPRFEQALRHHMRNPTPELREWMEKDRPVLDEISKVANTPLRHVFEVGKFAEGIKSQLYIDENPPEWALEAYHSTLKKYVGKLFATFHATEDMVKIRGGPLITEIVNNMVAVQNQTPSARNFLIYSAHDLTLLSLAYVLGVQDQIPEIPYYGDTFLVDLLDNGQVQVIYMHTETEVPTLTVMNVPGCGYSCPLDVFREKLSDMFVQDWEAFVSGNHHNKL